ncbi:MAG: hypothetical protein CMD69_03090 [Gammaproteobacteria bacterium]|nr:hypothetical protein [Gammaproteobacteria bacterium]
MKDFPVDIVYTWVDGSDKKWLSKKESTLKKYGIFHKSFEISGEKRFSNKDELKYSLRSIEKYCSWVRNIYLVTDDQTPHWLNLNNNNLKVINHKDIFSNNRHLPTFNSNAIEMRLHYIDGLSDSFLSFNDDVFFGRPTKKSDFFYKNGLPKLYISKSVSKIKLKMRFYFPFLKKMNAHASALSNSRKLILEKYNLLINQNLTHSVKSLNKRYLYEIENLFSKQYNKTLQNQFRTYSDIFIMALHAYYLIAIGKVNFSYVQKIRKLDFLNKINLLFYGKLDYGYVCLDWSYNRVENSLYYIKKYTPLTFCLNDWPINDSSIDKITTKFLNDMFSKKSIYEK